MYYNDLDGSYTYHMDALDHMILDSNYYPSVWRTGWNSPGMLDWESYWMPFEYTSPGGDWYPFHPEGISSWAVTSLGELNQVDVNSAFQKAKETGSAVFSLYSHDRNDLNTLVNWLDLYLRNAESNPDFNGVSFQYVTAKTAIQKAVGISDDVPPTLTITQNANTYTVTSNEPLWGDHPYVALKYANGNYLHVTASKTGTNSWTFDLPNQIVMRENVAVAARATMGLPVESVTASGFLEGYEPQRTVDGDDTLSSFWDSTPSTVQAGAWLELDLGSVSSITNIRTHFFDYDNRLYRYYIQVSNDHLSWNTVVNEKDGRGVVWDYLDQSTEAKYVRIVVTYNSANSYAHILEVSVNANPSGVTASSQELGHAPELIVDGVELENNYWGTNINYLSGSK